MDYNYDKLLGRIKEKFRVQASFAAAMGISEHSLSSKLNNKTDFKQEEIIKACDLLEVKQDEIPNYFFSRNVQKY